MSEIPELVREALIAELVRQEGFIGEGCCTTHEPRAEAIRAFLAQPDEKEAERRRHAVDELMCLVRTYGDARFHVGGLDATDAPARQVCEADAAANEALMAVLKEVDSLLPGWSGNCYDTTHDASECYAIHHPDKAPHDL